jgi:flagellar hook-basal body complex protein FliE
MMSHVTKRLGLPLVLISVAFALLLFTHTAAASTQVAQNNAQPADLSTALIPFVLLATAIERFWEAIFDWVEQVLISTGKIFGNVNQSVKWMIDEYNNAQIAVTNLATSFTGKSGDELKNVTDQLANAEQRLKDAQLRVEEIPREPRYVATKSAITIFGSLLIGLGIGVVGLLSNQPLLFFKAAGFAPPIWLDGILTGLIIGAGPGPVHSLIGTLQSFRDSVSALGNLAQGTALKNAAQTIAPAVTVATAKEVTLETPSAEPVSSPESSPQQQRSLQAAVRKR